MATLAQDARVGWVRSKACQGLGVEQELFDPLLTDVKAAAQLTSFLDGGEHRTTL